MTMSSSADHPFYRQQVVLSSGSRFPDPPTRARPVARSRASASSLTLILRWLRPLLARLGRAAAGSLSGRVTRPWPALILVVDASLSASTAAGELHLSLWGEESGPRGEGLPGAERASSIHLLLGSTLPDPGSERPAVWGRRLAGCLLCPAGRLPACPGLEERRLDPILGELLTHGGVHPGEPAWVAKATRACVVHWSREKQRARAFDREALRWQVEDRCGFLLNRLLSYPEIQAVRHRRGLSVLGGLVPALSFAWAVLYRSLVSQPAEMTLSSGPLDDAPIVAWSLLFASLWSIDVATGSLEETDAFLARTRHHSVIYLRRRLGPDGQAWGICHELAHVVLGHRSNTSYGLDAGRLNAFERDLFEQQEATADALASLWLHLFRGLIEIGFALGRAGGAAVSAFAPRADEACTG